MSNSEELKSIFQSDVRMALSGTLIDVELEEEEIDYAFRRAKKFYSQYGSNDFRRCFYKLDVERGKTEYDIPESINTTIRIIKPSRGLSLDEDMSYLIYQELFGNPNHGDGDWLTHEMLLQKVERNQKYFAFDEQMIHDEFENTITLLNRPRVDETWFLECYKNLEDHEYMQVDWIFRWTVAECKLLLGQAYRKFSSLAAPTGEVSLDGNTLVQEAKDEMREMREELENGGDGSGTAGYMFITTG